MNLAARMGDLAVPNEILVVRDDLHPLTSMADLEAGEVIACGLAPLDDVGDVRAGRPRATPVRERAHRCGVALEDRFDAAVDEIPHPAANPVAPRLGLHAAAIPDALHASDDVEVETHAGVIFARRHDDR